MAIDVMTKVWKQSKQKGSELLLLLGIADHCDDDGVCWPSIKKLAEKSRMSERQTQRNIDALVESRELYVEKTVGRHNSNRYFVMTGFSDTEIHLVLKKRFKLPENEILKVLSRKGDNLTPFSKIGKEDKKGDNMTSFPEKGDISEQEKVSFSTKKGDIAMSPESSWNRHEEEPSWREEEVSHSLDTRPPFTSPIIDVIPEEPMQTNSVEIEIKLSEPSIEEPFQLQVSTGTNAVEEKKPLNGQQALLEAFASLLRLNMAIYKGGWPRLAKEVQLFSKAKITAQDVNKFATYWYSEDFRGQKGEPPTLPQVVQRWEIAKSWQDPSEITISQPSTAIVVRPQAHQYQQPQRLNRVEQNLRNVDIVFNELDKIRESARKGENG